MSSVSREARWWRITCAPLADGGTRVELRVVMDGFLGGIVGRFHRRLTDRYLAMEAASLKARPEEPLG